MGSYIQYHLGNGAVVRGDVIVDVTLS